MTTMRERSLLAGAVAAGAATAAAIAVFATPVHITLATSAHGQSPAQAYAAIIREYRDQAAQQSRLRREEQQARQQMDAEIRKSIAPECADGDITRQAGSYEGSGSRRIYIPSWWQICHEWHLPIGG